MNTDNPSVPVNKSSLNDIIISATIVAMTQASEGLLNAFDSLEGNGRPLSQMQKLEIMQNVMFSMRDVEHDVRRHADTILLVQELSKDFDPDTLLRDEDAE